MQIFGVDIGGSGIKAPLWTSTGATWPQERCKVPTSRTRRTLDGVPTG